MRVTNLAASDQLELDALLALSARIGRDPLLVQASSGNTSVKIDNLLWIKASGKWLASALDEDCLVPVCRRQAASNFQQGVEFNSTYRGRSGSELRASIETAMHAVLPHKVVLHVHSVNAIAWAVRRDGRQRLAAHLQDLAWQWVDYVPSGLALARAIHQALSRCPKCQVFILENHGLVICAESCDAAEAILDEVERRLAVAPRKNHSPESDVSPVPGWRLPENPALHALGTDPVSRDILRSGVLYPCQAIFLAASSTVVHDSREIRNHEVAAPFVVVSGKGVLVQEGITRTQSAVLDGLMNVVQRLQPSAPIRYLLPSEIRSLLTVDAYRYRQRVEENAAAPASV